jgi:hypothetical protein
MKRVDVMETDMYSEHHYSELTVFSVRGRLIKYPIQGWEVFGSDIFYSNG